MGDVYRTTAADTGSKGENGNPVIEYNAKREAEEKRSEGEGSGTHPMRGVVYNETRDKFRALYRDGKMTYESLPVAPGHEGGPTAVASARPQETLGTATSPESLVTMIDGDKTSVAAAMINGWVEKGPGGTYVLTAAGAPFFLVAGNTESAAPASDQKGDEAANISDTAEEADPMMDRSESVQEFLTAGVAVAGEEQAQKLASLYFDGDEQAAEALLSTMELPEVSKARVADVRAEFSQKLDAVAISAGIAAEDLPAAIEWAEADPTRKAALRVAREDAVNGRTSKLKALATEYNEARVERCVTHGDGIHPFRGRDGKLMLTLPGYGAVSYAEAIRRNLIIVSQGE